LMAIVLKTINVNSVPGFESLIFLVTNITKF
jgi:hypothetical protein